MYHQWFSPIIVVESGASSVVTTNVVLNHHASIETLSHIFNRRRKCTSKAPFTGPTKLRAKQTVKSTIIRVVRHAATSWQRIITEFSNYVFTSTKAFFE